MTPRSPRTKPEKMENATSWNFLGNVSNAKMWISKF
jgi:hypothetical protein